MNPQTVATDMLSACIFLSIIFGLGRVYIQLCRSEPVLTTANYGFVVFYILACLLMMVTHCRLVIDPAVTVHWILKWGGVALAASLWFFPSILRHLPQRA